MKERLRVAASAHAPKAQDFPGFDSLRLLAAIAVIYSHAFVIVGPARGARSLPLKITYNLAEYGVYTFFILSGFLLARSLTAKPDPISYTINRALRILPGFIFYSLVIGLLVGPLFTSAGASVYFSDIQTSGFFRWGLDSLSDMTLPGLYAYAGEYSTVVNGSLWSLHYEALSYVLLLMLWLLLRSCDAVAAAFACLSVAVLASPLLAVQLQSIAHTVPYFAGGVAMNSLHARFGVNSRGAAISLGAFLLSALFGAPSLAYAVFGAYLIVFIGERPSPISPLVRRVGDLSYGLYLFGWPAEQIVVQYTGTASPWLVFVASTAIAALFAGVSFHMIEKHAMKWRHPVALQVMRGVDAVQRLTGRASISGFRGARLAFVVAGTVILLAPVQWWFVLESVGIMIVASLAGFAAAALGYRVVCGKPIG